MARGISLRTDFNGDTLRAVARSSKDGNQARRLLSLSLIYDGGSRSDAARHGGVGLQTIRDWVLRFNAEGPEGLVDGKSPGTPPRLNAEQRAALARAVEAGPVPYLDGVVRWRLCDLVAWLHDAFDVTLDETTVGRALKDMGYRKLSARPRHHAQDPEALVTFKKTSPPTWRKSAAACRPARP
jgi:transposase